jgi:uncharacterized protein YndB with AHSA1/START domain
MTDSLQLSAVIPAPPAMVFAAWMSADGHAQMTNAGATVEPGEGGRFTAWDGYIEGTHVRIDPDRGVVQRWRTTDFPEDAPDSLLDVRFEVAPEGTRLVIVHTEIPAGQGPNYEQGWADFYFTPMVAWFGR